MDSGLRLRGARDIDLEATSSDNEESRDTRLHPRTRTLMRRLGIYGLIFVGCLFLIYTFTSPTSPSPKTPTTAPPEGQKQDGEHVLVSPDAKGHLPADTAKRDAVVAAFKHAWGAYERDAWGCDDYYPIQRNGRNFSKTGGMGYMIADAIDTIHIMGLKDEYQRARKWIVHDLAFDHHGDFSTFETTIRVLGGLLSTYYLTEDRAVLGKAVDLADRLMAAFDTPHGIPLSSVDLKDRRAIPDHGNPGVSSTAEATTLQLEFRYLTQVTGNITYWRAVEKVMGVVKKALPDPPLVPIFIDYNSAQFTHSDIRLGSRADSYYEYLLKDYLQTGRTEQVYRKMYDDAMTAIHENLLAHTPEQGLLYTVELSGYSSRKDPKQDHLVCFLGGSLMLGATDGAHAHIPPKLEQLNVEAQRDWKTGVELIRTCMETHKSKTGLSPEITRFRTEKTGDAREWYISNPGWDARYMLRPETVESLFLAWRLTGEQKYRDWGWDVFSAIEKHGKIQSGGYATILNVDELPVRHEDKMETFFLAETLKYLYLLFADSSILPLTDVVFNTEAHPLPVFKPTVNTGFS